MNSHTKTDDNDDDGGWIEFKPDLKERDLISPKRAFRTEVVNLLAIELG